MFDREKIKKGRLGRPEIRDYESKCTQSDPPVCTTNCPMHVNVKKILMDIERGDFKAAYKSYRKAIPFVHLVSQLCDAPCQEVCLRKDAGGPIQIRRMEECMVAYGEHGTVTGKRAREQNKKIAVAGGSMKGLTAAYYLYEKGYRVTVYDETGRPGGAVWNRLSAGSLTEEQIKNDLAIFYDQTVPMVKQKFHSAEDCLKLTGPKGGAYDYVYDTIFKNASSRKDGEHESIIRQISEGKSQAITIDRILKGVSAEEGRLREGPYASRLYVDKSGIVPAESGLQADNENTPSEAEAIIEAKRCLKCQCMECVKQCAFLKSIGDYPKRKIREIANNLNITMGLRISKNMVNSCALCGLCEALCPNKLNMGEVCMVGKVGMVQTNVMPETIHDFPIRDMEHANGPDSWLFQGDAELEKSDYLFFSGCQLAALSPQLVMDTYGFLKGHVEGSVGIGLGCCGIPAFWSGRIPLFQKEIKRIKSAWIDMGRPVVITACPSCRKTFRAEIGEMRTIPVWDFYRQHYDSLNAADGRGQIISIQDACGAREDTDTHETIRTLVRRMGYETEEMKYAREHTKCCGYGGLVNFTNKEIQQKMIAERSCESDRDLVVYCAMCKDLFHKNGKRALHILDLLNGAGFSHKPQIDLLTYSRRRENRKKLKEALQNKTNLLDVRGREGDSAPIVISSSVAGLLNERLILEEEVKQVITHAEQNQMKVYNPGKNTYTASLQIGIITYWAEYRIESGKGGKRYIVLNAYSHRLEINKEIKENEHRKYRI